MPVRLAKDWFIDEWEQVFTLDENSPSGISWKVKRGRNLFPGTPAGYRDDHKWCVEYKGKGIIVHRIIYYLYHGNIDKSMCIDHIDGDPHNNSIDNLRQVSYDENMRNRKLPENNKSGVCGVAEVHKFVAQWSGGEGILKSKSFKVSDHGYEVARQLAIDYRNKKIEELNSQGLGYTERHGSRT